MVVLSMLQFLNFWYEAKLPYNAVTVIGFSLPVSCFINLSCYILH